MMTLWEKMLCWSTCQFKLANVIPGVTYSNILQASDRRIAFSVIGYLDTAGASPDLFLYWGVDGTQLNSGALPKFPGAIALEDIPLERSWHLHGALTTLLLAGVHDGANDMYLAVTETLLPCPIQEFICRCKRGIY